MSNNILPIAFTRYVWNCRSENGQKLGDKSRAALELVADTDTQMVSGHVPMLRLHIHHEVLVDGRVPAPAAEMSFHSGGAFDHGPTVLRRLQRPDLHAGGIHRQSHHQRILFFRVQGHLLAGTDGLRGRKQQPRVQDDIPRRWTQ